MNVFITILTVISFWTVSAGYAQTRTLELDAQGIRILEISCGAGELDIKGVEGLSQVEVRAEIKIREIDSDEQDDFIKRRVDLELKKHGNRARLVSKVNNSFFSRGNARINLRVRIPEHLNLLVNDGSGSIEIRDISGDIDIDDGSGSINIRGIDGNVNVDDGSGLVEIADIHGNVNVDDGSGGLSIRHVDGSVRVSDGSGGINIHDIKQDVYIREDGSGKVHISQVQGRITRRD